MWVWWVACEQAEVEPPAPTLSLVEHGVRTCADPSRRDERAFDELVLDGDPADAHRFWGAGVVAADLDGDDDLDLFLPGPERLRLFRNDGGRWVETPEALPSAASGHRAVGAVAGDVDGDGDLDLVVTRFGETDLLLVQDGGRFALAEDAALSGPALHSQSPALADVDGDGDLDLAIAGHGLVESDGERVIVPGPGDPTRLLLWEDGAFDERADLLPDSAHDAYTFVASFARLDDDDRPDLLLADDYPYWMSGMALRQHADGFVRAPDLGLDLDAAGMGVAAEDIDGDGLDDFLVPVWDRLYLLRSDADIGRWIDVTAASGARLRPHEGAWVGWGAEWVDLDLDGDLDAVVAAGHLDPEAAFTAGGIRSDNEFDQTPTVLLRDPGTGFEEATARYGLDRVGTWRGFAVADLNDDGWPDLALRDLDGPTVLELSRCGEEAWLIVRPLPAVRAVGATVTLRSGEQRWTRTIRAGGTSLASGGPPEALFGLGDLDRIDAVEVRWPDGTVQRSGPVATRQRIDAR
ncbi:MAG: VCBS repeat-containing protein [Alphaproteobacteria bacterium]|nr:VCBS repeat-containing protein [Alphaproteobacteria bacterium]MCB9699550.1 VCBS repeat-containing protein [Alphaproteobacteria bacterium]